METYPIKNETISVMAHQKGYKIVCDNCMGAKRVYKVHHAGEIRDLLLHILRKYIKVIDYKSFVIDLPLEPLDNVLVICCEMQRKEYEWDKSISNILAPYHK